MQLAFRRDYTWGTFFNEHWREDINKVWRTSSVTGDCNNPNVTCFSNTNGNKASDYLDKYQIKFPNGQGTYGVRLVPNGKPKICTSPLHKVRLFFLQAAAV